MAPSAVPSRDTDAGAMPRDRRKLALCPKYVSDGRLDVPQREDARTSDYIFACQAQRPRKDTLTLCTPLPHKPMIPSWRSLLNIPAGILFWVNIVQGHREWFLTTNGTPVGFVRLSTQVNRDRLSKCTMTPFTVLFDDAVS